MSDGHFIAGWFAGFFTFAVFWASALLVDVYYKTIGKQ